jgi:hypothetical protein
MPRIRAPSGAKSTKSTPYGSTVPSARVIRQAHHELRLEELHHPRIVRVDARVALHAHAVRCREVDEEQTHLGVLRDVAGGVEHPVTVEKREGDGVRVECAHETRIATLLRHRRTALVVDGPGEEHVTALDERTVHFRELAVDGEGLDPVGDPAGVVLVLEDAVPGTVKTAHERSSGC